MTALRSVASMPIASVPRVEAKPASAWLDGRAFDGALIFGVLSIAMLSGVAVALSPSLFTPILIADLWLLGYHHVIGTFARIAFERDGLRRYRALYTWVPVGVVIAVVALAVGIGAWTLPTIYLYWQWWHYTRQSYGIAQLYRLKTGEPQRSLREMMAVIYLLPLTGILYRSYQAPDEFLGLELRVIPVPAELVAGAAVLAIAALAWYAVRQVGAARAGRFSPVYNLYLASHLAVFGTGYLAFGNIDHGWLVLNVWHNAQYMLMVWLFNNKQFKDQIVPEQALASKLSQRRNIALFFGMTLVISTVAYLTLSLTLLAVAVSSLPIMIYQSINFHHYIVDSFIWKSRRPKVRSELGIQPAAVIAA